MDIKTVYGPNLHPKTGPEMTQKSPNLKKKKGNTMDLQIEIENLRLENWNPGKKLKKNVKLRKNWKFRNSEKKFKFGKGLEIGKKIGNFGNVWIILNFGEKIGNLEKIRKFGNLDKEIRTLKKVENWKKLEIWKKNM